MCPEKSSVLKNFHLPMYLPVSIRFVLIKLGLTSIIIIKIEIIPLDFLNALKEKKIDYSMDGLARLSRSHGQTLYDIYSLRHGKCFPRICDIVVWPGMYYIVLNHYVEF